MAKNATVTLLPEDERVFDYGDMQAEDSTALEHHATAIEEMQDQVRRISAAGVIRIGKELKEAQERLAGKGRDGMFKPWVTKRCGFTPMSAYRAIAAHEVFAKSNKLLPFFDASALYLLSSDSCPEEATQEALRLAEEGQRVTHKLAKELKKRFGGEGDDETDDDLKALFGSCSSAVKALRKSINALAQSSWGYEVEAPAIRRALRDIQTALKEALLTEQCPYCDARGCTACNETGMVTSRVHEQGKESTDEA